MTLAPFGVTRLGSGMYVPPTTRPDTGGGTGDIDTSAGTGHTPLPGQVAWKNGATNLMFGENDGMRWSAKNISNTASIRTALSAAHIGVLREWFYFTAYNVDTGLFVTPQTDDMIRERITTAQSTGAAIYGCLYDTNRPDWTEHLVSVIGDDCLMYEFGNESQDVAYWDGTTWQSPWPWQVEEYIGRWTATIPRLRAVNPRAKFGALVSPGTENFVAWIDRFGPATNTQAARDGGYYPDMLVFHEYVGGYGFTPQQIVDVAYDQMAAGIARAAAKVEQYYGDQMPIVNSEWGIGGGLDGPYGSSGYNMFLWQQAQPGFDQARHDVMMAVHDAVVDSHKLDLMFHWELANGDTPYQSFNVTNATSSGVTVGDAAPNGFYYGFRDAVAKYRP